MEEENKQEPGTPPASNSDIAAVPPGPPVEPLETLETDINRYVAQNTVSERQAARFLKDRQSAALPATAPIPPVGGLPPAPLPARAPAPVPTEPSTVVLPTTEIHSPLNAPRASAGELVAVERAAELPKVKAPPLSVPEISKTATPPIETFQGDVQTYVRENKVSAVTVAAAEQARLAEQAAPIAVGEPQQITVRTAMILGGFVLIGAALGALGYVYIAQRTLPAAQNPVAPFIAVDQTTPVALAAGNTHNDIMQALVGAKDSTKLSVGLVAQLVPTVASTSGEAPIAAQDFFAVLTPNMPAQLLRSLQPNFLLGVHSFDTNQPFIMLSVDSYEQGYAGMLAWEATMQSDLSPLFDYTPPQRIQTSVTASVGSSTLASSTAAVPSVIPSAFVDTIIENHDARAIENSSGDSVLLWTFLDRSTILIAVNSNTVKEVISRLKSAPTITIPH